MYLFIIYQVLINNLVSIYYYPHSILLSSKYLSYIYYHLITSLSIYYLAGFLSPVVWPVLLPSRYYIFLLQAIITWGLGLWLNLEHLPSRQKFLNFTVRNANQSIKKMGRQWKRLTSNFSVLIIEYLLDGFIVYHLLPWGICDLTLLIFSKNSP